MQHKITVRFDDELYTQIVGHELNPSDLLRLSVRQFLNPKIERQVVGQDEIKDEMYTPINFSDDRYLKHLEGEIVYLRGIHNKVMDRVTLLPEVVMPQSAVSDVPSVNSRGTIGDEINHVIKERSSEDIIKTEKKKGFLGRLWG